MKRLRARILALVALLSVVPFADAASIEVTTFGESVDGDGFCSVREAVAASERAARLSSRDNNRIEIENYLEDISDPRNLDRLQFPNQYYPRSTVQSILELLHEELAAHDPVDTALLNDVIDQEADIDALPEDKVYLADVEETIDLIERALDANQAEIDRLDADNLADGCDDGSSFDTVLLEDGTYTLTAGEVVVAVNLTIAGNGPDKTTITTTGANRLFTFAQGYTVSIEDVTLTGGNAGAGDGGAVLALGTVSATSVVFDGNLGANGGALAAGDVSALKLEDVTFLRNIATGNGGALYSTGPRVETLNIRFGRSGGMGNIAAGNGGGAYLAPVLDGAVYTLTRGHFIDNQAVAGAALFVGGLDAATTLVNQTFGENVASDRATVEVAGTGGSLSINNITMVDNQATTGTGGLRVENLTAVYMDNSLVAGNTGGAGVGRDCDLSTVVVPAGNFGRNFYADPALAAGCPGLLWSLATPENTNYALPPGETVWTWLIEPLDVEAGLYVPLYPVDVLDAGENRLVNRGAGSQEENACAADDQRGSERGSFIDADCDIGAVEYQIGRRVDDFPALVVNERACIDVVTNDIGDAWYTPYSLEILSIERPGTTVVVASRDPQAYLDAWEDRYGPGDLPEVLDLDDPALPQSCVDLAADPDVQDVLVFTSARGFQGETNVTYVLGWQTDQVATPTTITGTVSGIAHVSTDSARGITSSTIGGSTAPLMLLWLALLGARRRVAGAPGPLPLAVLASLLLVLAGPARAVDNVIYVDSAEDPVNSLGVPVENPGDKKCTLREALSTARNDQANLTRGDCLDGNEGPDIIEFGKDADGNQITSITLNGPLVAWGGVTIRCPEGVTCTIRRELAAPQFALIDSRGSLGIDSLVLENGHAGNGNGGAISSAGSVSIHNSVLRNNTARTGGAIFLRGTRTDLTITNSTFSGNTSTGTETEGGGAVAMTAAARHVVNVAGSTFTNNQSAASAAALSIKTTTEVVIVNSTFSGNVSSAGAGAIDLSGATIGGTLRNLTVVDNTSGVDYLAVQRAAVEFSTGSVGTVMLNSILAANYNVAGTVDANCGGGTVQAHFNLFGESFAAASCPLGPPALGNKYALDTLVWDDDPLTSTDYLAPLALNGFTTETHAFNDPVAVDGILVDAGTTSDLVEPFELRDIACAKVDQRGASRASGNRCDIGAFEFVQVTAVEDYASNAGRRDRLVLIDVTANDVFDDLEPLNQDCVGPDVDAAANVARFLDGNGDPCVNVYLGTLNGAVSLRRKDNIADVRFILDLEADEELTVDRVPSALLDGEFPKDFVPGWDGTASEAAKLAETYPVTADMLVKGYVLVYDNLGVLANDDTASGTLSMDYEVFTTGGAVSNQAPVEMSVENVPPYVDDDRLVVAVGATAVLSVLDNDIDHDATSTAFNGLDPSTIKITSSNCEALDVAGEYDCEFGRVTVDFTNGTLRWTPFNSFNPFTETLTYTVKDANGCVAVPSSSPGYAAYVECLSLRKEGTGTVTLVMNRPESNGGAILGDDDLSDMLGIDFLGGTGLYFLGPLLLAIGRRRRRA